MTRLYRPHVPLDVRCRVAMRQLGEIWPNEALTANKGGLGAFLDRLLKRLSELLDEEQLHLDHDPALATRERKGEGKNTVYTPDANDPEFLFYRGRQSHKIKTNVRGDGAQFPDRVLIARARRHRDRSGPARSGVVLHGKVGRGVVRSKKIRGLTFQQIRCKAGARCHCNRKQRKVCSNYRRSK